MLNYNLNIIGSGNKPIVPIGAAPEPTTTTTTTTTTTSTTTTTTTLSGSKNLPSGGLLVYLDATVNQSYPGSGSVWYDLSGNAYNAQPLSGSTFPDWNVTNKEFIFNGVNDVLGAFPTSSITNFSAFAWCKLQSLTPTGLSDAEGIFGLCAQTSTSPQFKFDSLTFTETIQSYWEIATENNNRDVVSPVAETSTDYLFIGMTCTSNSQIIWRNGSKLASGSYSVPTYNTATALIGSRHFEGGGFVSNGFFTGSLSMCLLYDRVLTESEIQAIYAQGR